MEQKIETGGPAFPCHAEIIPQKDRDFAGMTLRDYFAAKAMQGMAGSPPTANADGIKPIWPAKRMKSPTPCSKRGR